MAVEQEMFQLTLGGINRVLAPKDHVEYAVLLLAEGKRPREVRDELKCSGYEDLAASCVVANAVRLRTEQKRDVAARNNLGVS